MKGDHYGREENFYDVHTADSGISRQDESGRIHCMEMWGIKHDTCNGFIFHGKSIYGDGFAENSIGMTKKETWKNSSPIVQSNQEGSSDTKSDYPSVLGITYEKQHPNFGRWNAVS